MNFRPRTMLPFAALWAVAFYAPTARADDDGRDRWEDRQERFEEAREDRAEALEEHWERQRELQRTQYRQHAWYGNVGPYYQPPAVQSYYRTYRVSGAYAVQKPFSGYYDDCITPHCNYDFGHYGNYGDCGPFGRDCHDEIRGHLSIGPISVCWD